MNRSAVDRIISIHSRLMSKLFLSISLLASPLVSVHAPTLLPETVNESTIILSTSARNTLFSRVTKGRLSVVYGNYPHYANPQINLFEGLAVVPKIEIQNWWHPDLQISIGGFSERSTFRGHGLGVHVDSISTTTPDGKSQISSVNTVLADNRRTFPYVQAHKGRSGFTASPFSDLVISA